jgi:hypothetical protein
MLSSLCITLSTHPHIITNLLIPYILPPPVSATSTTTTSTTSTICHCYSASFLCAFLAHYISLPYLSSYASSHASSHHPPYIYSSIILPTSSSSSLPFLQHIVSIAMHHHFLHHIYRIGTWSSILMSALYNSQVYIFLHHPLYIKSSILTTHPMPHHPPYPISFLSLLPTTLSYIFNYTIPHP